MFEGFAGGGTVVGPGLEELADKVLCVERDIPPVPIMEDNIPTARFLDELGDRLGAERRVAAQERVCDYAQGPDVNRFAVPGLGHDFGRGVPEGTGHGVEDFVGGVEHFCDSKVGEDERGGGLAVDVEEIFGFEVWGVSWDV